MSAGFSYLGIIVVAFSLGIFSFSRDNAGVDPVARVDSRKVVYEQIFKQLEPGGDLLVVANVEGVVEEAVTGLSELLTELSSLGGDNSIAPILEKLPGFLEKQGLFACQGVGLSSVPRVDGLYSSRLFIARTPEAASTPLWSLVSGGEPRRSGAMDFLGEKTHIARVIVSEPVQAWNVLNEVLVEFFPPTVMEEFKRGTGMFQQQTGTSIEALFNGLGDEFFVAVTLDVDSRVMLPLESGLQLDLPRPGVLVGIKLSGSVIPDLLQKTLVESGAPLVEGREGEIVLKSMNIPVQSPIPVQPTYAVCNGFLLIGLNETVIREALRASSGNSPRLENSPEYIAAFKGMPQVNNGMFYISQTTADEVSKTLASLMESEKMADVPPSMKRHMNSVTIPQMAMVIENRPDGVLMSGVSSAGLRDLAGTLVAAPLVGVLGVTAAPAVMHARFRANEVLAANNLRMINSAVMQVMLEENLSDLDGLSPEKVEGRMAGGNLNDLGWPEGTVLLAGRGAEAQPIPGGELGPGKVASREAWTRFLRGKGGADGYEIICKGKRISSER